jgi:hypothetical protein
MSDTVDAGGVDNEDEITSLLLRHEKRSGQTSKTAPSTQRDDSDSDK